MNRIDKLFKSKLANKGLTYTDQHWAGMEALLDEKKKVAWYGSRKLIAVLALLAGSILASTLWWNSSNSSSQKNTTPTFASTSKKLEIPKNKIPTPIIDSTLNFIPFPLNIDYLPFPISNYSLPTCGGVIYPDDYYFGNPPFDMIPSQMEDNTINLSLLKARKVSFDQAFVAPTFNRIPWLLPNKKWRLYAGVYANAVNYNKLLSIEMQSKTASQQAMPSTNLGLQLRLEYKNWSVLSGIGQTNLYEQTNFVTSETTWDYTTSYRLIQDEYTETPRGKKVSLIKKENDSVGTTTNRIDCPNCETKISYINVPLAVHYELTRNRIVGFGQVGINMAILQKTTGLYAVDLVQKATTDEAEMLVLPLEDNLYYLNPILWQTQANVGLKYRITNQWNIWGNYGVARSVNSITTKYGQRALLQQFGLGFEYRLR